MKTQFAYWILNVSGGLVITNWPMKTDWTYKYNKKLARTAEQTGYKYGLAQARFIGSYNANIQLEALSVANATKTAVEDFKQAVRNAGKSSPEGEGMWSDSDFNDLIQYNDGFKTGLIGTHDRVVERIRQLDVIGVDIILTGFLHYTEDLPRFGNEIISAVRKAEPLEKVFA